MSWRRPLAIAAALGLLITTPAIAQTQQSAADGADMAWVMVASLIALLGVLPGLALSVAGAVRPRAMLAVALQVVAMVALASLVWAIAGYSLAFGPGPSWIGGVTNLGLANLAGLRAGMTISEPVFALSQSVPALLAAALLVGAIAERARLGWLMLFVPLWLLIIYVPVTRWLWSSWLAGLGTRDFAGGLAIHSLAGISALVLAALVGRRTGLTRGDLRAPTPLLRLAGAGLLWVGLLGLAGGAALSASDEAGYALLNSHLAACAGALGWLGLARLTGKSPRIDQLAAGAIAGLVAAASAAGFIGAIGAIAIGFVGAGAAFLADRLAKARGIDDPGAVFAIHGVAGLSGALLMVPLAAGAAGGVGYADSATMLSQLVAQLVGIATVLLWGCLGTLLLALLVSVALPMRAPDDASEDGEDSAQPMAASWHHG